MVLSVVGARNGVFGAVVDCQARDALPTERDGAVANDAGETEVVDGEKIGRDPAEIVAAERLALESRQRVDVAYVECYEAGAGAPDDAETIHRTDAPTGETPSLTYVRAHS